MSISFRLPRRTKTAPKHARTARTQAPSRVPVPLGMPGTDTHLWVTAPGTREEPQR